MNASVLLQQTKMMLTYPAAQPTVFRPTFVSHGMIPHSVTQFPSFPLTIAPTILHTQLPHSSFQTFPTTAHSVQKQSTIIPTSPNTRKTTNPPSPKSPSSKQTHSSFSIDSILGKRVNKSTSSEPTRVPISPIINNSPRATCSPNGGLMYFYTPATSQPPCSPFPFAAAPRQFDHDLQRSPLGPMIISAGNTCAHIQSHTYIYI